MKVSRIKAFTRVHAYLVFLLMFPFVILFRFSMLVTLFVFVMLMAIAIFVVVFVSVFALATMLVSVLLLVSVVPAKFLAMVTRRPLSTTLTLARPRTRLITIATSVRRHRPRIPERLGGWAGRPLRHGNRSAHKREPLAAAGGRRARGRLVCVGCRRR